MLETVLKIYFRLSTPGGKLSHFFFFVLVCFLFRTNVVVVVVVVTSTADAIVGGGGFDPDSTATVSDMGLGRC